MHILSRPWDKVGGGRRSQRKFFSALRASVWSKDKGGSRTLGPLPWIPHCYLSYLKPTASDRKEHPWCCIFSQTLKKRLNFLNVMSEGGRQGMGWGLDCLCWPWGRAFDWSCSPRGGDIWIFLRPTWRLTTRTKKTETEHIFSTSTLHACAVRSGKIWKSWRPTRTSESWVDFTVLSSNFVSCVLACFWSIELLKILWYQSKRK